MGCFTLFILDVSGNAKVHSTYGTLAQAVNQASTAPRGQGWRIIDRLTGQTVAAGVGRVPARQVKPSKPPTVEKRGHRRTPAQPKDKRSKNARR